MYFNLTFFAEEDKDVILESTADLNLPNNENKAGGNSDQVMPSLLFGQSNNER